MLEMLKKRIKPKDWDGEEFNYKQIKLDGYRMTLLKFENKLVGYGRTVEPESEILTKYPHVVDYEWWKAFEQMPNGSIADGEIYVIGGTSSDVTNQLTIPNGRLDFSCFAVPIWNGYDKTNGSLEAIDALLKSEIGESLTPWYSYKSGLDTREQMLTDAKMLCIEGWVLKRYNYQNWWRLKPVRTLDCIITGFTDGRGKYLGGVGALMCSVYIDGKLTPIAKVSGMDDETRWNLDEDKDLGRVIEVKYDMIGAKGKLRFPRFVRWRDDKPAKECIL